MKNRPTHLLALALCALAFGACRRQQSPIDPPIEAPPVSAPAPAPAPFRVTALDLGNAIDASQRISAPGSSFAPSDTIYAAVLSDGSAPNVEIVARWTYEDGQLVSESTQVLAPDGPAATEFHIAKPDGLPTGKYKVEVTANGETAASKEFEVK
jgi:hypothetical protein